MFKRIAIIGCPGSGKTYMTKQLQSILNIPIYHLDQYYFYPNWQKVELEKFLKSHKDICDTSQWIIDGQALVSLRYRLEKADCVIFLDIPRIKCLISVIKRTVTNIGRPAPGSPAGCIQYIFSLEFLKFLHSIWSFNKTRPIILDMINFFQNKKQIYIIKSRNDVVKILNKFRNHR